MMCFPSGVTGYGIERGTAKKIFRSTTPEMVEFGAFLSYFRLLCEGATQ